MYSKHNTFKLTAVSAALVAVFGSAWADDAELKDLTQPGSTVSIGIGNWSNSRDQQGIYDDMKKKGAYGLLDADVVKRDEATGTWMKFNARNLGLDSRELKAEYLQQGNIGASAEYTRISRDDPKTFTTRLQGVGTTTNIINTTAANPGPLQEVRLGTDRDMVSLGFYKNLMPGLDLNASFKNEDKKGTRNWSRGSAVEFLAEPISSTTKQWELTLNYTTKVWQLSGGYYGSWFNNKNDMVTARTAGAAATVANTTYLSLPLDNQAHKLFLNGGYTVTPSTRGTFKLEYTRATQDEYLPMKGVPTLSLASSPDRLGGAVNTTLIQLGVTSRPINQLSLAANLRYHNVKDVTPVNRFIQTNAACASGQCVDNTPLSYKTLTGKLEGTYRLPDGYSLTAGLDDSKQDRSVPVSNANGAGGADTQRAAPWRARLDETTYRLEVRRSLSDTINGAMTYSNSDRKGSTYTSSAAGPSGAESDLINPLNIANRSRHKVRAALDWSPIEQLSVQFNAAEAKDTYPDNDRAFGLKTGTARLYGLDTTYQLNDRWKLSAWYSYDRNQAKQLNTRAAAGSIKDNNLEDTGNSLGLGLQGDLTGKIKLGADLQWTQNVGKYQQTLNAAQTANVNGNLDDIRNILTKLNVFGTYALDKASELRFDLIHERWKTNDWTWMFAGGGAYVFGTTTDGTVVTSNQKQTSNFISARYIYKFQ